MRQSRFEKTLTPNLTENHPCFCGGSDLAAGSSSNIEKEDIPKSAMRVLNSAKVREEYRRKRKRGEDTLDKDDQPGKRQKHNAGEKPKGTEDKGTLAIKVRGVNLKETAKP